MAKKTVFDKASFNSNVRSEVAALKSKVEEYLAGIMQEEAKSKVDNSFKDTLAQFKASVTAKDISGKTKTFPDEVYKVLLARHLAEYKPPEINIQPKLVKEIASYLSDILGSDNETVTTADGVYKVSTTFAGAGLSTVTDSNEKLYILDWKPNNKAKTEIYKLLEGLKTWGQNFPSYFFEQLIKSSPEQIFAKWTTALITCKPSDVKALYRAIKKFAKAQKTQEDDSAWTDDDYSNWLSKLTKELFSSATNKKVNTLRSQCQTLDTLATDTKLLKDYKASDDLTADTIKSLTSYKKFITAYNKLQTAIGESTSNFDSLIPDYIGYKITSVVGGTFSEDNATIICATGKNNIEITGSKVSINAGKGNDTITSGTYDAVSSNVKITAGVGNDEIYNYSSNTTIDAGDGNDFIRSDSNGKSVSIVGGKGSDTVDSHGNRNRIEGGAGNDSISNYGNDVTISGEDGADTIRNFGSGGSVLGGAGDDDILVMGGYVDGGTGVDTIAIQGSNVTAYGGGSFDMLPTKDVFNIASGASNVYIKDFEFGDVLNLPAGTYTARIEFGSTAIRNSSGKLIVWLSGFTDRLENFTYAEDDKQATDGDDSINNDVSNIKIDLGAGDDTIQNGGHWNYSWHDGGNNVTIEAGTGDDSICNYGDDVTINAGDGNDYVFNSLGANISIDAGDGDDIVNNYSDSVTIDAGEGNNTVYSSYYDATIKTGSDDDFVSIFGSGSIDAGEGNNTIKVYGYSSVNTTVKTASGNDFISIHGNSAYSAIDTNVDAGDGNNTVMVYGDYRSNVNATVKTGSGDDYVSISHMQLSVDANLDLGDGNNTVMVYGNGATVNSTVKTGSGDDYFYIYGGSIDAGEGNNTINGGYNSKATVKTGSGNDYIEDCSSIDAGEGDNTVHAYYDATVKTGSGNDYISGGSSIDAGDGNNRVSGSGTIKTGSGDDFVSVWGGSIDAGDGNNTVYASSNATVMTGDGDDFISLVSWARDNLIKYRAGDGNDTIWGFNTSSTLSISGGEYTRSTVGNDVIIKVGDGSILLKDANSKTLNIDGVEGDPTRLTLTNDSNAKVTLDTEVLTADASARTKTISIVGNELNNTITGGANKNTLRGGDGSDSIVGGKKADKLYGDAGDDTLIGNAGNDTVYGGAGNDLFVYTSGNDLIADYATGDKISLGAAISKATVSGSNVVLTTGNGSLTIKNAKGKTLSLIDSTGKELETIIGSTTLTVTDADKSPVTLASTIKTVNASSRTTAVKITGNSLANSIAGGSGKDTLSGGAGNDSISGGAGNDSINGGRGNDSIVGGAGNDKLIGYTGNDTLIGGAGNDSLWGQAGADTFIYSVGDGKDIIYGFDDTDMLEISGTFSAKYYASSDKLVFKVGSTASAITLKNFTATTFHVNGDTYVISGSKFVKTT